MTCTLFVTIMLYGNMFQTTWEATGKLIEIEKNTYKVDFSFERPDLKKPISVPKSQCEKAE